jgi:hypothetical protein
MDKIHRRPTAVATSVLVIGIVASLAGNVQAIHLDNAAPGVGAHVSAIFWPVILFGTVELLIHVPWMASWRDRLTKGAVLLLVAAVAGWVSYWHLAHVLSSYGYDVASRYVGPLAVDAAMVLAALALNRVGQARRLAAELAMADVQPDVQVAEVDVQPDAQPVQLDTYAGSAGRLDSVADEARTWLDSLEDTRGSQEPTMPVPVSPAPAARVQPEKVPAEAAELIRAWAATDQADRPRAGDVDALVGAHEGVSPRTARGWRAVVLSS